MHNMMAEKVLRANILFFDSNPIGRITTRFSRDMTILDNGVPVLTIMVIQGFLRVLTVIISISIVNPWLLIFAAIAIVMMIRVYRLGVTAMIDAQRLDQRFFGPINTTFTMVITGLVTFRAYRKFDFYRI